MSNELAVRPNNTQKTGDQLLELIQEAYPGYHPIVHAADIAHDKGNPAAIHLRAIETMLKYTTPDVKSIDISARMGGNIDKLELLAFGLDDLDDVIEGESMTSLEDDSNGSSELDLNGLDDFDGVIHERTGLSTPKQERKLRSRVQAEVDGDHLVVKPG